GYLADSGWTNRIRVFWFNGWGMDTFYGAWVLRPFKTIAELNKSDVIDSFYAGLALLSRGGHRWLSTSQNGRIRWYASSIAFGAVVIIAIGWLS
ncbi:MAG: NADH-quinone oxidoreductase subunit L, partial [Methylobacter sp.]